MLCNKCTYWAGDSLDSEIRFITGHHPNCGDFISDKNEFITSIKSYVDSQVSNQIISKLPQIKEEIQFTRQEEIINQRQSATITRKLYSNLLSRFFPIISNAYIYKWESDMLAVNKSNGRITEFEIKISRNDFKADLRKDKKHSIISDVYNYKFSREDVPNYFYYVTPPGLLDKKEIMMYSGLIEVGLGVKYIKRAPLLHDIKVSDDLEKELLKKIYWKYWK